MTLFECLMRKKTKEPIVSSSPKLKDKEKREGLGENVQWAVSWVFQFFRERERDFSLGFWSIGPSVFNGARRKVALRDEDYAWTPIW